VVEAPSFDPVERRTISEDVRDAIAGSIRTRALPPGSRLPPERVLSEQFGVARTSVREAIQGLVSLGLLEKRNNRTFVVERMPSVLLDGADRRKQRVRELFEVRQIVEVPIARLVAHRATRGERDEIVRIASKFRDDMSLGAFRQLDRAFHSAVAGACGNATLAEVYGKVMESLFTSQEFEELLSATSNRNVVRDIIRTSGKAHRAIADAIQRADAKGVVEAAERHLEEVEHHMISRLV
jgi:DNA-binding FadR family transcriptional regulator